jgi:hypothetical protein
VLTLALFLKFFGVSFLSRVSTRVAQGVRDGRVVEVPWPMRAPQIVLAGACILLGLAPALGYWMAYRAIQGSAQGLAAVLARVPAAATVAGTGVTGPGGLVLLSPLPVALAFGLLVLLAVGISQLGGSVRRRVEPWLCGYAAETDAMRYGARNLYREALRYFPWAGAPRAGNGNGRPGVRPPLPGAIVSPPSQDEG